MMPSLLEQSGLVNLPTCNAELGCGVLSRAKRSQQTISKEKGPGTSPCLNPWSLEISYQKLPESGFSPSSLFACLCACLFEFLWIEISTLLLWGKFTTCTSIRSETWHASQQELEKSWLVNITEFHFWTHPHLVIGRFQFYKEVPQIKACRKEILHVRLPTPSDANTSQGHLSPRK